MATSLRPGYQGTSSKLRNSCDSCAATKVRCTKEKPFCVRCAKRRQPCVYGAAKRAGRTSGTNQPRAKGAHAALTTTPISPTFTTAQTLDHTATSSPPPCAGGFSPSLDLSRGPCSPSYPDIFATLRSPHDASQLSMPTNSFTELDELFASAVALPLESPPDGDPSGTSLFDFGLEDFSDHGSSNFTHASSHSSNSCLFPGSCEADTRPTSQTPQSSSRGSIVALPDLDDASHVSITTEALQAGQPYHPDLSCQCLARALGLLARLFPGTSGWWNLGADSDPFPELPDFERVIAQNEQTSEVIRTILQCPCSNDSYLLVTLSLVVFKIIAWYTAAACAASGEDPIPSTSGPAEWPSHHSPPERVLHGPSTDRSGYDSEGEDQQRIAVQLILSKLAGVQVSVDQLSQRLRKLWETGGGDARNPSPESSSAPSSLAGGNACTRPYSAELAHTLEADLRKRLYELSQAIVERLRR